MLNLLTEFQELRKVLCVCPCCGGMQRASDMHIRARGPAIKTWLDHYEAKSSKLDLKEERFNEKEARIRERAVEKGRQEAKRAVNRCIFPAFRAMKLNPFDVKPVMDPIDFVVFNGMTDKKDIANVIFLSKRSSVPELNAVRKQVSGLVQRKSYDWHLSRIDERGKLTFE